MNKIDELVKEMCPGGVEYVRLGDVCEIISGWGFPNREQGLSSGDLPFFKVSDMNLDKNAVFMNVANNYISYETANRLKCKYVPANTIIFPKIGAAILTNKKRITICDACYDNNIVGLIPHAEINFKFLFYLFTNLELAKFADYSGAMPSIRKSTLQDFKIPLPPLPVQERIVEILDKFTDLTMELNDKLKHELDLRKKQYEYYRDMLLSFENYEVGVEKVRLGDIAKIKNGKDYKQCGAGNYPVYGSGGIMAYIDNYVYDKPSVLIPRKGSLSNLYYVDKPFWNIDTIFYTQIDDRKVLPKYLYYLLLKERLESLNTAGGVPSLTQSVLNNIELSIPSIEIQKKIINVLDNFDALCNDLNAGLPAEIEMRTKQYEYYRDRLLSFK